ncbi:unnamed protein product [Lampetra planeri]
MGDDDDDDHDGGGGTALKINISCQLELFHKWNTICLDRRTWNVRGANFPRRMEPSNHEDLPLLAAPRFTRRSRVNRRSTGALDRTAAACRVSLRVRACDVFHVLSSFTCSVVRKQLIRCVYQAVGLG